MNYADSVTENAPPATGSLYENQAAQAPADPGSVPFRLTKKRLVDQLSDELREGDKRNMKRYRALEILQRHPEFEEFIELQELLKGRIYY